MWIMFLVVMGILNDTNSKDNISVTASEFSSREKHVKAVEYSRKRSKVYDTWRVQK